MLPYFLIWSLWFVVAVAWPVFQSLHALQVKDADFKERKIWIVYWLLFVVGGVVLHYFEWLIMIPFYVISFYIDIYYETQLLLALYLVNPMYRGLDTVLDVLEKDLDKIESIARELLVKAQAAIAPIAKQAIEMAKQPKAN